MVMTAIIIMTFITTIRMITSIIPITRCNSESTRKILTENGEKKKFALGLNAGARGQVFAEMTLGQEVGEKRRKSNAYRATTPPLSPLKERLSVGRSGSSM
jgi:hypothetical protein